MINIILFYLKTALALLCILFALAMIVSCSNENLTEAQKYEIMARHKGFKLRKSSLGVVITQEK